MGTFLMIVTLAIGYFAGMATKGVQIHITKKEPEVVPFVEEEHKYNVSTASQLPDTVRNYFDESKGFMNLGGNKVE